VRFSPSLTRLAANPAYHRLLRRWAREHRFGNRSALALIVLSLAAVLATFAAFAGFPPFGPGPVAIIALLAVDSILLLLLAVVVIRQILPWWSAQRGKAGGSRLHRQLLLLFSAIAVTPTIVLIIFSTVFFHFGLEQWFSQRVGTALDASLAVADAYLAEHRNTIRADAMAASNDLDRQAPLLIDSPERLRKVLLTQAVLRSLAEAAVIDSKQNTIAEVHPNLFSSPPHIGEADLEEARQGRVVLLTSTEEDRVYALLKLEHFVDAFLYIGRPVDPQVIEHTDNARQAVAAYRIAESQRGLMQIAVSLVIVVIGLLLLFAAMWVALRLANRFIGPVSDLAAAAEEVRSGNFAVTVPVPARQDELRALTLAFNRMTGQLGQQRWELLETNRQLDARRRFIEAVLGGVSAGVIGLDSLRRVSAANRRATSLLNADLDGRMGAPLDALFSEVQPLLDRAEAHPGEAMQDQLAIEREGRIRTLLTRVVAEVAEGTLAGFVITFDDITDLVRAQKTAAWADVAQRLAHEIKNPLTPIQLSAERLKRRYLKQIHTDPETFQVCTDTIIRQVEDLERLVSEFSGFARMPTAKKRPEDLALLVRQVVSLLRDGYAHIAFETDIPAQPVSFAFDPGLLRQALTNLLKNAAEAIGETGKDGVITVRLDASYAKVTLKISDNGPGWPETDVERLLEPYVTTKKKGTGLGLAIVKKIVEEHGGFMKMETREPHGARVVIAFPAIDALTTPDNHKNN
jgi:two-component system nitrogen regulation sensor histidine kinase NtrY